MTREREALGRLVKAWRGIDAVFPVQSVATFSRAQVAAWKEMDAAYADAESVLAAEEAPGTCEACGEAVPEGQLYHSAEHDIAVCPKCIEPTKAAAAGLGSPDAESPAPGQPPLSATERYRQEAIAALEAAESDAKVYGDPARLAPGAGCRGGRGEGDDMIICREIRKVRGGYVLKLRWPYGDEPEGYGEVICRTLEEALEKIRDACDGSKRAPLSRQAEETQ